MNLLDCLYCLPHLYLNLWKENLPAWLYMVGDVSFEDTKLEAASGLVTWTRNNSLDLGLLVGGMFDFKQAFLLCTVYKNDVGISVDSIMEGLKAL